jgi:hypothetical protein
MNRRAARTIRGAPRAIAPSAASDVEIGAGNTGVISKPAGHEQADAPSEETKKRCEWAYDDPLYFCP